jgi:hypothetical protein
MTLSDNLIRYWKMDDAASPAVDALGVDNLAQGNNPAFAQAGKISNSIDFSGANNRFIAKSGGAFPAGNNWTINMWVNLASAENNDGLISVYDNSPSRQIRIRFGVSPFIVADYNGTPTSDYSFALFWNLWTMVTATWDGTNGEIRLYINGGNVSNKMTAIGSFDGSAISDLTIGNDDSRSRTRACNGKIDEVGIWSRELSDTEITALYNSGNGLAYPFYDGNRLQIQIGDAWKLSTAAPKINIGDAWKTVAGMQINIGDAWKTIF